MSSFDLGASRRKRDGYEPKDLIITDADGGIEFKAAVSPELPATTLDAGSAGEMTLALRSLFLDPADADQFISEYNPSLLDLAALLEGLYEQGKLGEALASGLSSMSDGTE